MNLPSKQARIAVLNSHPIQYFAPLYAYLNNDPGLDITALYMSDFSLRGGRDKGFGQAVSWDVDLLSGYRSVFLGKQAKLRVPGGFFSLCVPEVWKEIRSGRYDALIIHGHNYLANLIALAAAKWIGIPILVRGETHLGLTRPGWRRALRGPVMSLFYALCDRCLAIGTANAAFYRAMGVPQDKIFLGPYSVDNDRFRAAAQAGQQRRQETRARYGIPADSPAILYAAKFTARKHPEMVLQAARRIRNLSSVPFSVVMCGAGEMEAQLKDYCRAHNLTNVVFTGFVNQADLPNLYAASDVFVLPSENEPWGLAVNEAMCAELPIVLSREIGCVVDLVENEFNGFTPDAGDIEGYVVALKRLIEDDDLRHRQGDRSAERISRWGYKEFQAGLRSALKDLI